MSANKRQCASQHFQSHRSFFGRPLAAYSHGVLRLSLFGSTLALNLAAFWQLPISISLEVCIWQMPKRCQKIWQQFGSIFNKSWETVFLAASLAASLASLADVWQLPNIYLSVGIHLVAIWQMPKCCQQIWQQFGSYSVEVWQMPKVWYLPTNGEGDCRFCHACTRNICTCTCTQSC